MPQLNFGQPVSVQPTPPTVASAKLSQLYVDLDAQTITFQVNDGTSPVGVRFSMPLPAPPYDLKAVVTAYLAGQLKTTVTPAAVAVTP
jgi:hypothetical protein